MNDASQRSDHNHLLRPPAEVVATQARLDAIVVPSARSAPYLREAAGLAQELNTRLVVLCSKRANRADLLRYLGSEGKFADVVAIDLHDRRPRVLPTFKTSTLLNGTRLRRATDVSRKRNLAIVLARMVGWKRIAYLDDDIRIPEPLDLRRVAGQLDAHDAVGLEITGCLDNSVVCHAIRDLGGEQGTFVGGGALAVDLHKVDGFFPDVYNEDWFYLLGDGGTFRPVTRLGRAVQYPYDPYADPDRARREEFGDDLAEGLFAVLGDDRKMGDADFDYWHEFLVARRRLIVDLHAQALGSTRPNRVEMATALAAALGRLAIITPRLCVGFLDAWQRDREEWVDRLDAVPSMDLGPALGWLGLAERSTVWMGRSGALPNEPRLRRARPAVRRRSPARLVAQTRAAATATARIARAPQPAVDTSPAAEASTITTMAGAGIAAAEAYPNPG